jgi:hypothetical protein
MWNWLDEWNLVLAQALDNEQLVATIPISEISVSASSLGASHDIPEKRSTQN